MSEERIPDEAHGNDITVTSEARAGRVFLNIHVAGLGEQYVFLTVKQARRVAHQIGDAAQQAHASSCDTCRASRGDS